MTRAAPLDRWTPLLLLLAACSDAGGESRDPDAAPDRPAANPPSTTGAAMGAAAGSAGNPGEDHGAATVAGSAAMPANAGSAAPDADDPDATVPESDPPAGEDGAPAQISFACPGGTIAAGMNTLVVGSMTRSFYTELPSNMSGSVGIVFSWHGFNDAGSDGDAAVWRNADEVDANADPANPVIVVTPFDVDFEIPVGLDWQFDQPTSASNVDLAFFEAMVGCFNAQYDIDPTRIYSYGFSAGSVMTSLIHSAYPKLVSAIVCVSGMWFNDQVQKDLIQLLPVSGTWPMLDARDGGTVLLTHGGPNDVTVLNIANLENMAQAAFPFLKANGRLVIDCPHGGGHMLHPELTTQHVMRFFAEHRGGEPSPYASGVLSGYPSSCSLRIP
ncbi:MAG TPA: PHB depolymerase family esterase [Polyangiales bacterium]|nr:PHB depolymerase family esterase [Polyangiales bacterium]